MVLIVVLGVYGSECTKVLRFMDSRVVISLTYDRVNKALNK